MFNVLVAAIKRISISNEIKNIDFIFFATDTLEVDKLTESLISLFPFFTMSCDTSKAEEKNCILIPDAYLMCDKTWPGLINDIIEESKINTWKTKDLED